MRARALLLAMAVGAAALVACGSDGDADEPDSEEAVKERAALFGDDRVGRELSKALAKTPSTYQDFEKLFKVGRECARADSKEIYVVEEPSSRLGGTQELRDQLLPRVVVTGCNLADASNADTQASSFGLMAALVSSFDGNPKDPLVFEPLEVMAFDDTTAAYNFYVFEPSKPGKPGTITRVMREPSGNVIEFRLEGGRKTPKKTKSEDKRCFNCHVNGGPLMNELTRPWTNWVSVLKTLPLAKLDGESFQIVNEAAPTKGHHKRSSFAQDLERIVKAATRAHVEGIAGKPTTGFAQMALEGSAPGGLPLLMKSVFCQTELNYVTSSERVPLELFVDRDATAGAGLVEPEAVTSRTLPFLLPVRSEHDKRVEKLLQKKKILAPRTVAAIRLVDDEREVFSKARCDLLGQLGGLDKAKVEEIDGKVRALLVDKVRSKNLGKMSAERERLVLALLDPQSSDDAIDAARDAYATRDLRPRFQEATEQLRTAAGRQALEAKQKAAKDAARAMFPGDANPLPVFDKPAP
jgi:hypothetical protein